MLHGYGRNDYDPNTYGNTPEDDIYLLFSRVASSCTGRDVNRHLQQFFKECPWAQDLRKSGLYEKDVLDAFLFNVRKNKPDTTPHLKKAVERLGFKVRTVTTLEAD